MLLTPHLDRGSASRVLLDVTPVTARTYVVHTVGRLIDDDGRTVDDGTTAVRPGDRIHVEKATCAQGCPCALAIASVERE